MQPAEYIEFPARAGCRTAPARSGNAEGALVFDRGVHDEMICDLTGVNPVGPVFVYVMKLRTFFLPLLLALPLLLILSLLLRLPLLLTLALFLPFVLLAFILKLAFVFTQGFLLQIGRASC